MLDTFPSYINANTGEVGYSFDMIDTIDIRKNLRNQGWLFFFNSHKPAVEQDPILIFQKDHNFSPILELDVLWLEVEPINTVATSSKWYWHRLETEWACWPIASNGMEWNSYQLVFCILLWLSSHYKPTAWSRGPSACSSRWNLILTARRWSALCSKSNYFEC